METIKYLNDCGANSAEDALENLKTNLGIKYSNNELFPELYVLNYCQIDSPKFHPVTLECRSLVVEFTEGGTWKVVSRSFDRFFNFGEIECGYNMNEMTAYEKMDGSLIGLFYHDKYGWLYRTRSMIMPTGKINAFELTWDDLIEEALGELWLNAINEFKHDITYLDSSLTYILEVTSPENRVVTRYLDRAMTLLSARVNSNGLYCSGGYLGAAAAYWGWRRPKSWTFGTMSACADAAKELRDLNEGYVMYDSHGAPVCKVKNPAYVAAHRLRGKGIISPKSVVRLLEISEMAEYLSIFPEDAEKMSPYVRAYFSMFAEAESLWALYSTVPKGKEFALKVKDSPVSGLLFRKKAGVEFKESFAAMIDRNKVTLVEKFINKELV